MVDGKKITSCLLFCIMTLHFAFAQTDANYALSFNGTNWVEIPDHPSLNPCPTCPFTAELWVFRERTFWLQHIFGKRKDCSNSNNFYQLVFDPELNFGNNAFGSVSTHIFLPTLKWHHLAMVFDGSRFSFYYDGVFIASDTGTIVNGAGNSLILAGSGTCYEQFFGGKIDNVRIWNIARTQEEIRSDMVGCINGSEPGLAGAWDFDEGIGNIVYDLSPHHNHGRLVNNPEWVISNLDWCEVKDKRVMAASYINIGDVFLELKDYTKAMKNYNAGFELWQQVGDSKYISISYRSIGMVYYYLNDYTTALKNFRSALEFGEKADDESEIANASLQIGNTLTQLQRFEEAKNQLERSLLISKKIASKEQIMAAYDGLSKLATASENYHEAIEYYKMYTLYKDSLSDQKVNLLLLHLKEQYASERKDKEILQLTNERQINGLLLRAKQDSLDMAYTEKEKLELERDKVRLENETGRAFNLYNQKLVESLGNEKRIQQLEIEKNKSDIIAQKAEMDHKQKQLALINKEKDIQELQLKKERLTKNFFMAGLSLFVVLSFFIYRNYRSMQEVKLLSLRNKIASDLHDDVGSTLSSISMFSQIAQKQSKEGIPALETIEDSSKKMLDAMADIVWTINPENDQFEKIIMRMRSFAFELLGAKDIDFEFDANENVALLKLPMEARKNLYLVFKEATNNLVKYSEASRAKFALNGEKDKLTMVIEDNGKGFDTSKETLGNGLKNMKRRAADMGAQLLIDSTPGSGTMIRLELTV